MAPSDDFLAILGSATPPGRLRSAIEAGLNGAGLDSAANFVDLAELDIGPAGRPPVAGDDTPELIQRVESASVVLLASPIYRGSITGSLKNLLDHVPVTALRGTVVPIVTMGGSDHHYLGGDRHLRDILTFFGALPLPTSLYLNSKGFEDGTPTTGTIESVTEVIVAARKFSEALAPVDGWGTAPLYS